MESQTSIHSDEIAKQLEKVRASEKGLAELMKASEPSEEVCLAAVRSFPRAIRYLSHPSNTVQRAAVAGDPQSILVGNERFAKRGQEVQGTF